VKIFVRSEGLATTAASLPAMSGVPYGLWVLDAALTAVHTTGECW
jgi:hypothetical protein